MHNFSTDGFQVAICTLDLQHVKQEFYTFKCRVRSSGLELRHCDESLYLTARSAGNGRGCNYSSSTKLRDLPLDGRK